MLAFWPSSLINSWLDERCEGKSWKAGKLESWKAGKPGKPWKAGKLESVNKKMLAHRYIDNINNQY